MVTKDLAKKLSVPSGNLKRNRRLSDEERAEWDAYQEEMAEFRRQREKEFLRRTASKTGIDPDCPLCGGLGYVRYDVPVDHEWFGKLFDCECRALSRLHQLEAISGLGGDELRHRFDTVITSGDLTPTGALVEAAREFVLEGNGWFTVWGGYGTAKTLVLQAAVNEFREAFRREAVYVVMADLVDWVRAGYKEATRDQNARARIERLLTIPFLAIDEVDRIRETEWAGELRFRLLDRRYRDGISGDGQSLTMFATNQPPVAFDGWIESRMRDGRFILIEHTGPDVRPYMGGRSDERE